MRYEEEENELDVLQKKAAEKQRLRKKTMGELLRSKGFMWLATSHEVLGGFQQAGNVVRVEAEGNWMIDCRDQWEGEEGEERVLKDITNENGEEYEYGDRRQELVFIGMGLKYETIQKVLDESLLTDDEMKLGPEKWLETMEEEDRLRIFLVESDDEEEEDSEEDEEEEGDGTDDDNEENENEDQKESDEKETTAVVSKKRKGKKDVDNNMKEVTKEIPAKKNKNKKRQVEENVHDDKQEVTKETPTKKKKSKKRQVEEDVNKNMEEVEKETPAKKKKSKKRQVQEDADSNMQEQVEKGIPAKKKKNKKKSQ